MKKSMVTGGAGFLGSHLCEKLLSAGSHVICVDNFYTGRKENIGRLLENSHFELLEHDITIALTGIDHMEIDDIYNLACPASPIHYKLNPVQTTKTCVHGTINVLELAKTTGAKVFQASTSEVYGDPQVHPQPENYWGHVNCIGPRSCYDEGKRCAETLFFDYYRQYAMQIKVGRIFNTYGPRMLPDDGRVISNFIVQALQNKPITIYGDGSQTRSFCYADDLITAIIRLMENTEDTFTGPVNLGNPMEIQIVDLAKTIIQLTNSDSEIVFNHLPEDDPKQRQPDISLAQKILNWQPGISLEEGLKRTIRYFEEKL